MTTGSVVIGWSILFGGFIESVLGLFWSFNVFWRFFDVLTYWRKNHWIRHKSEMNFRALQYTNFKWVG